MNIQLHYIWTIFATIWLSPCLTTAQPSSTKNFPTNALNKSLSLTPSSAINASASRENCSTNNVLKGLKIKAKRGLRNVERAIDGKAAGEGSDWNGLGSATLKNVESFFVIDLGKEHALSAFIFQGDNNDSYSLETSSDGTEFRLHWTIPETSASGMRMRKVSNRPITARYLKLSPIAGDGAFSVGELQAFCAKPTPFPPVIKRVGASKGKTKTKSLSRDKKIAIYKICIGLFGFLSFIYWLIARNRKFEDDVAILTSASCIAIVSILASLFGWFEMRSMDRVFMKLSLGLTALSLLWFMWIIWTRRTLALKSSRFTKGLYLILIWCSAFTFVEFGTFHGGRAIHYWDSFHYYIGAKYFPENGYDLIYQCAAISDVEDGRREEFKDRKMRNLRHGNLLRPVFDTDGEGEEIVRHITPEAEQECRSNFTPERWAEFQQDLRLFRGHMGKSRWGKMFMDHGFNATPVWLLLGNPIANIGGDHLLVESDLVNSPANLKGKTSKEHKAIRKKFKEQKQGLEERLGWIVLIDGLLYFLIFALIWWAFGIEVCGVAMLIWSCGYPWHYDWTGGSFGRVPWLFMCTLGVCALKRGLPFLGGAAITWSMLLRLFPGAFIAGIAAKIIYGAFAFFRGKQQSFMTRTHFKITAGCTVALVGLVLCSLAVVGDIKAYGEFWDNTMKHKQTKLTNHMGLPTIISWDPAHVGRKTKKSNLDDPWEEWKRHRSENLSNRKPLHLFILAGLFGMLMYIGRRRSDWEVTALSGLMVVSAVELTCYYFTFVILMAPFAFRRGWYAVVLGLTPILSQVIYLLPTWNDERYVNLSFLIYTALGLIVIGEFFEVRKEIKQGGPLEPNASNQALTGQLNNEQPDSVS